jgi:putative transposase
VRHQCELLELCRSSYYYQCCPETEENLALMRRLDELHLGIGLRQPRRSACAGRIGHQLSGGRLLRLMGIEAIYAKPRRVSQAGHQIYRIHRIWR